MSRTRYFLRNYHALSAMNKNYQSYKSSFYVNTILENNEVYDYTAQASMSTFARMQTSA